MFRFHWLRILPLLLLTVWTMGPAAGQQVPAMEAKQVLVLYGERLDLPAIREVELGALSGIELQRQLTAAGGRTPVIFITSQDAPATREQALAAGCAAYFSKATAGTEVVEAIRRAAA